MIDEFRRRSTSIFVPEPWASEWGWDEHGHWQAFHCGPASHALRWIEPGRFMMGSPEDEPERWSDEGPRHEVVLSKGFWLGETTCTQELWQAVVGPSPSRFKGLLRPVERAGWDDVQDFLERLNRLVPGLDACLPTEAQWEYACRAGTTTPFSFGATISTDQANYDGRFPYAGSQRAIRRRETVEVHALPCNQWGLRQMHGNVWEWCQDFYGPYGESTAVDPAGPAGGDSRVARGGSWSSNGRFCRSAYRYRYVPVLRDERLGFRIARGRTVR
jgi:formylglycine-generating enzyme